MQIRPDVLVIGPGALGTCFATRLAASGQTVHVACRSRATRTALERDGLVSEALDGTRVTARVVVHDRAKKMAPGLVVLATKCADTLDAWKTWGRKVPLDTPVLGIQNGLMGDRLRTAVGDRYVCGTVGFPASLVAPGHSVQTGPGGLYIGGWPDRGATVVDLDALADRLAPIAEVHVSQDMRGVQWTKLIINSAITGLGVLTGQNLGDLLRDGRARRLFLRIIEEGHATGRAHGVRFTKVAGLDPDLMARRLPGRSVLLRLAAHRYHGHRSSSLQSLERGRRTEVDELNGRIVAAAGPVDVATPANAAVARLVQEIEAGTRTPGPDLLDAVLAQLH